MDRRPLILISAAEDAWRAYWIKALGAGVVAAGGEVKMLWELGTESERRAALQHAGGLLLGGGFDIEPRRYGAEGSPLLGPVDPRRDAIELPLAREAIERGVPILGICRGMQVMNVCLGGTLYRDGSENPGAEDHPTGRARGFKPVVAAELAGEPMPPLLMHPARAVSGSLSQALLGTEISVNSYHHQHLRALGVGVEATVRAMDGVVEAIEITDAPAFAVGVQWELQAGWRVDPLQFSFYGAFVEAAQSRCALQTRAYLDL